MKKQLFITFILFSTLLNSQTPGWKWARSMQGPLHDGGTAISSDTHGNLYVTGSYQTPSVVVGTYTLSGPAIHNSNFFVAKYDSSGTVIWAKTGDGTNGVETSDISTDADGNSYVVGGYGGSGTLTLDGNTIVSNNFNNGGFIAKYNSSGTVTMLKGLPREYNAGQYGRPLTVGHDASGNTYLTGTFENSPPNPGGPDSTMLIKLDNNGNTVWKRYMRTPATPPKAWTASDIAVDPEGNSYITGVFTASWLSIAGSTVQNMSNGGQEVYIAKFDNNGNLLWTQRGGRFPSLYKPSISADGQGNCYITGHFLGNYAAFGTTTLTSSGTQEMFLAKLDNAGNYVWAKKAGSAGADNGNAIANDIQGNVYVTGYFQNAIVFNATSLFGVGAQDIFVVKYDPAGNVLWAKKAGGSLNESGTGITVNNFGHVAITGGFSSSYPAFDNITLLNCDTITNPGETFVARMGTYITGINELDQSFHLTGLFPNPSTHYTILKTSEPMSDAKAELYNAAGQLLRKEEKISGLEYKLDLSGLPHGIYFVHVTEKNRSASAKLIVND